MNLLILSPGRRVEIVNFFKETFHKYGDMVFTLDMSPFAPALYSGDKFFRIDKDFNNLDQYIQHVLEICLTNKVGAILTLIDPELVLLSNYKALFESNNIQLILSDCNFIKDTFDKYSFYQLYHDKIQLVDTVGTYQEAQDKILTREWDYPLFAKLRDGSASIGIKKVNSKKDFEVVRYNEKYIYQPFIDGQEYGVDLYFDMISGNLVSAFIKKKISMRAGETDKAISVKSEIILDEMKMLENLHALRGPIDVDVFVTKDETIYINEINPRFGGGHPHAYGCGVNFMELIYKNLEHKTNEPSFNNYDEGIMMLKYNGLLFRHI